MEQSERERKKKKEDRRWFGEFRNLSTICISMSAIYMQMAACMSDKKARRVMVFLFFQRHITLNDAKLQPTSTRQHKTQLQTTLGI